VGTDIDSRVGNRFLVDAFYVVPEPENLGFSERLREIVLREKVSIILPQVTRELLALARSKEAFAALGCQILVNDPEKIEVLNDKYKMMKAAAALGVRVPKHYLVTTRAQLEDAVYKLGYPAMRVVVKPPVSSGMRGLRILGEPSDRMRDFLHRKPDSAECSLEELLRVFADDRIPDLLVCEYLPGMELSVDCLCARGSAVIVLPRTRERVRTGITFAGTVVRDDLVIGECLKLIEGLKLDHVIGFQFKYSEEGYPAILECNPRVQGTMVLGAFCRANIIVGAVRQALGLPLDLRQDGIEWGVSIWRYWGGVVYNKDGVVARF
jgi:carbamoyl-phosphate synthase large subunit